MLNTKNMFNMIISDTERSSTYLFYFVLFFCEELRKRIRATGEKSGHVLFFLLLQNFDFFLQIIFSQNSEKLLTFFLRNFFFNLRILQKKKKIKTWPLFFFFF